MTAVQFVIPLLLVGQAAVAQTAPVTEKGGRAALPYAEIPAAPEAFTAESVVARTIDGLGFRFYWASEGLRVKDLTHRPSPAARTAKETVDHILELSRMILNAVKGDSNRASGEEASALAFEAERKQILDNLNEASVRLKLGNVKLQELNIAFESGQNKKTLSFWHVLNGPIADALWHTGQLVSFRRTSGNPFNKRVNVLTGKVEQESH